MTYNANDIPKPEQEPVAWANRVIGGRKWLSIHASKGASDKWLEYRLKKQAQGEEYEQVALYTTPPQPQPQQEPVAWLIIHKSTKERFLSTQPNNWNSSDWFKQPLYTTPPQEQQSCDKRKPLEGVIGVQPIGYHSLQLIFKSQDDIAKFKAAHGIKE